MKAQFFYSVLSNVLQFQEQATGLQDYKCFFLLMNDKITSLVLQILS